MAYNGNVPTIETVDLTPVRRTERPRKPNMRFADDEMDDTVRKIVTGVSTSPKPVQKRFRDHDVIRDQATEEEMLQQALNMSMEGHDGCDIVSFKSNYKSPAAASAGTPKSSVSLESPADVSTMTDEEQIAYAMEMSMQELDCDPKEEAIDDVIASVAPMIKEQPKKGKFSRKSAPQPLEVHALSSSDDSDDSLPDLDTRLQNNLKSVADYQQIASTSYNSPKKSAAVYQQSASTYYNSPKKSAAVYQQSASTSYNSPKKSAAVYQQSALSSYNSPKKTFNSPIKTHTLSSDDEENPGFQIENVHEDIPVDEDEISIIEDRTLSNTSRGPVNLMMDDLPAIICDESPSVSSKTSSYTSAGARSSGWSTFDARSITSSSSHGDREMEKENYGIKRSINCLDEDDLPVIHDASAIFESNPVSRNYQEIESLKDILPIQKKSTNKKLRTEEIREEKAEKKRQREALKEEREAEKARLKVQKEAEKAASRCYMPGECMKYMIVNIDRRLLECVAGSQIISQLQTSELRFKVVDHPVHSAVTLLRVDPLTLSEQQEEEGIVVMDVEDFVTAVWQQVYGGATTGGLTTLYRDWTRKLRIKKITLLVYDIETYLRGNKATTNRQFRANVLGEETDGASKKGRKKKTQAAPVNSPKVSRIDIESALVTAQLACGLNHRLFASPDKVGLFLAQLTKAVAEAPLKREKKEASAFSWYAEGDSVNTVKVDKSGVGLLKLWHQQLRMFNNVGVELAQAIAREYPSPQELVQAYRRCDTNAAAALLLSDILVRRSTGPLASTRRIGPELSKKVHLLFTSTDPDANLAMK